MNLENNALVEPMWLHNQIEDPDLVILDASMQKTVAGPNQNYNQCFIKGTYKFDFEKSICDLSSDLPHTMPSPDKFSVEVRKLGVNNNSKIVVYDNKGI
jgi:thiosulfate/3-mercaptopyruvate sulfurtransferase